MRTLTRASLLVGILVMTLFSATTAQAHNWGSWHWNRYGSSVTIAAYTTGSQVTASKQAANDWSNNTILYIPQYTSHTDMSVFDGNFGATGWGGLASLESVSGDHILHGHARVNLYYGYGYNDIVGIQCQEVGHLFGLDHSNDGCMGKGYYNSLNYTVSHNWTDIYNKYRYTHH